MTLFFLLHPPWPKSVAFWVVWLAVAGSAIGGSGLNGSCSRFDESFGNDFGPFGECNPDRLIYYSGFVDFFFLFLKKKIGPNDIVGCHESTAITILAFLNWILCKSSDFLQLRRKTTELLF